MVNLCRAPGLAQAQMLVGQLWVGTEPMLRDMVKASEQAVKHLRVWKLWRRGSARLVEEEELGHAVLSAVCPTSCVSLYGHHVCPA